jgi:hypothetical protein
MMHRTCLAVAIPALTATFFLSNQCAGQGHTLPACGGISQSQYQFSQIFEPY